ncbi:cytochrome P450 [Pseudomonas indica]|uniref:cytochrome P450 n=1 Tax=Pseudomonas indica TaxID=137658 RepID=UPI000BAB45BD|nr:cytochrome P450 [Pseudomonas indica]PAU58646.1 cytochrome [Pseudomonas indica]
MSDIPRDRSLDSTLALLREGYGFIPDRCRRYRSDLFETRLLLQRTFCLSGESAARLFYDPALFTRTNAVPRLLQKTLFGVGGVQGLDGKAHRLRKQMFMDLMTPERMRELLRLNEAHWREAIETWTLRPQVVLLHEVQTILCRSICAWAGVLLMRDEVERCRAWLAAMIDGAGGAGLRHWRARRARAAAERWCAEQVRAVREGRLAPAPGSALQVIAEHRENERLLDPAVAAVELLNVLRPAVAIARFVIFASLELHRQPQWYARLAERDELIEPFAQEVRRLYAFFPFVAARVREGFHWRGHYFEEGTRVLLDLFGTNRDPRTWERPDDFLPERFQHWDGSAFNFITQGGGEHRRDHRCPGEWITIELLKLALRALTRWMRYEVPDTQDLSVSPVRMPALPRSRFVIRNVRPVAVTARFGS